MKIKYFGHPEDKPLNSSLNDMKAFKKHVAWSDIVNWIDERSEYLRDKLMVADNMEEVRAAQEGIKQLQDLKEIPDLMIEELNSIEQEKRKEQKDER